MAGELLTILYFFVTFYSLGFSLLHLFRVKLPGDFFERNVLRLAAGLAIFPLLILILHSVGIPLHWLVLLAVSLIVFVAHQVNFWVLKRGDQEHRPSPAKAISGLKIKKKHLYHAAACIFAFILFMVYIKGAFGYPYLEDDDPWLHAMGVKYVSEFHTYWVDTALKDHVGGVSSYLWPYPPFYTSMMGILHQLNTSVSWTLKFFNVLLISLGIIFFYIMFASLTKSHKHAMIAAGFLVLLPSFMSHFIWAQTLAIVCFAPVFLVLNQVYDEGKFQPKWFVLAILLLGSMFMIQPWAAGIFGFFMGFYWISRVIAERSLFRSKYLLLAIILGCVVSLLFWVPAVFVGVGGQKYDLFGGRVQEEFFRDDSGMGLVYGIKDFVTAPKMSKMDQATGLGAFMFFLVLLSILVMLINIKKLSKSPWFWAVLLWFLFGAYNFYALKTGWFRLTPHRMWAFFSIPVALIAAKGMLVLQNSLKKRRELAFLISLIIVVGIVITSGYPKYVVQTSAWPPGMLFRTGYELQGYASLKSLPANTKVMPLCDPNKDRAVVGMDMIAEKWDYELYDMRRNITILSPESIVSSLRSKGYSYLIMDSSCVDKYGLNDTNLMIGDLADVSQVTNANEGFILMKL